MLMPVMDGWQCARELRARYGGDLPIVVISAAENVQSRGKEIGADEVLPKPFEMSRLLEIVGRYATARG
jgi:CheY-like chemotaxis protein